MAGSTGSMTIDESDVWRPTKVLQFTWVTGSSSQADVTPTTATSGSYDGRILAVITNPSTSAQPDDNYDITITDKNGFDLLNGSGANRDETNTEFLFNGSTGAETVRMLPFSMTQLTLNITNAGSEQEGIVTVYIGV